MLTKPVKTIDGELVISIPNSRDEITLGMLIDLTPAPGDTLTPVEQISKLSGIPVESETEPCLYDIMDMQQLNVFDDALYIVAKELAAFVEVQDIPESITFYLGVKHTDRMLSSMFGKKKTHVHKTVPVITDLGIEPAGAYMEAKDAIQDDLKEWQKHNPEETDVSKWNPKLSTYSYVLALYFHGKVMGGRFSTSAAREFEKTIRQLPITQALPIARHFFLSYPNLSKPKVKPSLEVARYLKKKQG